MLQVLIIGNGFDLAHGAPTSFSHFSEYLKTHVLLPRLKENNFSQFFESSLIRENKQVFYVQTPIGLRSVWESPDDNYKSSFFNKHWNIIYPHLRNKLLRRLYVEQTENWFDVESTYFHYLVEVYFQYNKNKSSVNLRRNDLKRLNALNQEFNQIKTYLKEYFSSLDIKPQPHIGQFLKTILNRIDNQSSRILIIDFNYTKTITKYDILSGYDTDYFPIHGTLDTDIIFGFGNDKDEEYQAIKRVEKDEFLTNFKTQKYLLTSDYQNIINSLTNIKNPFKVSVLGHSLGITDKTLLQEIFSSDNCKSINIYKRRDLIDNKIQEDRKQTKVIKAFTKLTTAATRIFDDEMVRMKITNFEDAEYFP